MYMKLIFYSSLLGTINAFLPMIDNGYPQREEWWNKVNDPDLWYIRKHLENIFFINESIFDEHSVPSLPFYLKVEKSSISTLPLNTFKNCSAIRGALLSKIDIQTISPGVFDGLDNLIEINLSKNKLTQIEDGVFNKAQNLKYLDLSYNYIENISEKSFSGLEKLNYLYLQGNEISLLYNDLFKSQINSLLKLDISSNRLKKINVTFKAMSRLTHLFLQMNDISSIAPDSFENITSLETLNISYNSIPHIQCSGLEKLNNISLQNNRISFLDLNLFDSQKKSLTSLNISSNNLKEINTVFHGMSHLTYLYLQLNNVWTLASNSFQNLSSLQVLDLSHNCIRDLPEHILSGSETLTHLYLYNNKITFLDSKLFESQKHSLILLSLSSNTLREISAAFRGLSHLTNLYLQENEISSIATNAFEDVNSLEYLDISHNNLERFQYGLFYNLDHLIYLNFSYNKFEEFPFEFISYLTYLKELVFENNEINSLNRTEILHHYPSLRKIGLSGNFNWSCSRLAAFVKELRINKIEVIKGNYFTSHNVRGMACYIDSSVSSDKDSESNTNTQGKHTNSNEIIHTTTEKCNIEIDSKYSDKNIKDLINVTLEKHNNGNVFIIILIATSTIALIAMTVLQFFFVIKLKRSKHEQLELL